MSSCIILRNNKDTFISSDSAMSSFSLDGTPIRISNYVEKIFKIGDSLIFCSGKIDVVKKIMSFIYEKMEVNPDKISSHLKLFKNKDEKSKNLFDVEVLIIKESEIIQISEYMNYDIYKHPKPSNKEIQLVVGGIKNNELFSIVEKNIKSGLGVKESIEDGFSKISCEQVGGFATIWRVKNNKEITKTSFNRIKEKEYSLYENKSTGFLVVAEAIVGNFIASSQLVVSNTSGTFSVDADGATLIDSTLTVTSSTGNARLVIDPNNTRIFRIQKNISTVFTDMFYVDTSGNITFTGALSGATGSFTGSVSASSGNIGTWTLNAYGIQSTDLAAKLWSFADGTYDMNVGSFVVVDDGVTRYVDYQGDTFNINVSDQVTFTPTNTFNIGTVQLNLNIQDSTTGLQVRGSPTWNSDITITAGNTLVIRNGLIFDYF